MYARGIAAVAFADPQRLKANIMGNEYNMMTT
jgi:hypothetical protein